MMKTTIGKTLLELVTRFDSLTADCLNSSKEFDNAATSNECTLANDKWARCDAERTLVAKQLEDLLSGYIVAPKI